MWCVRASVCVCVGVVIVHLLHEESANCRAKNLEAAKSICIEEDKSLPAPVVSKICGLGSFRDQRVRVFGWVDKIRRQGRQLMFVILRDGTGYLQCLLADKLCQVGIIGRSIVRQFIFCHF